MRTVRKEREPRWLLGDEGLHGEEVAGALKRGVDVEELHLHLGDAMSLAFPEKGTRNLQLTRMTAVKS